MSVVTTWARLLRQLQERLYSSNPAPRQSASIRRRQDNGKKKMTACFSQSDWTTIAGRSAERNSGVAARLTRSAKYLSLRRQPPRMVPRRSHPPNSPHLLRAAGTWDSGFLHVFPSKGNHPRLPLLQPVSRLSTTCLLHLAPSRDQRPEVRLIAKLETCKFSVFVFLPTVHCLSALVPSAFLVGPAWVAWPVLVDLRLDFAIAARGKKAWLFWHPLDCASTNSNTSSLDPEFLSSNPVLVLIPPGRASHRLENRTRPAQHLPPRTLAGQAATSRDLVRHSSSPSCYNIAVNDHTSSRAE